MKALLLTLLVSLSVLNTEASPYGKNPDEKSIRLFLKEMVTALQTKDSSFVRQHCKLEVFGYIKEDTKNFSSTELWEWKLSRKAHFGGTMRRPPKTYRIALGKSSDTIGPVGGVIDLSLNEGQWKITRYRYPK